ncbi:hypothetical protein DPMN_161028 [Dreissena polymorpha]|uniref:Uncharacterized protein n=1 Tax=Dreissena polymorpha TaxID=45954 RepID=A0A9D4EN94_DREPO|nr:hypothetical protein DPMN_161028 [Dreissena polymorpha]
MFPDRLSINLLLTFLGSEERLVGQDADRMSVDLDLTSLGLNCVTGVSIGLHELWTEWDSGIIITEKATCRYSLG